MSRNIDDIINEAFSALDEAQSEGEKLVLMLPKFTPTEAWGDPKSMDRQQVNKIFRSISSGASIQARIDGINKFLTPESAARKTSVNSIINHLIIVESLRACVKNFGASSAGFVFEAFIAALTSGSQQSDKVGGTLPIEDIVAFSTVSGKSAPLSLKLLSGTTQVKGSYTNLIDYLFFRNSDSEASVGYLVAFKDSASDVCSMQLELFHINRENLPEIIRSSAKGGLGLMNKKAERLYKKALADGDYETAGKILIGTQGYSKSGAGHKANDPDASEDEADVREQQDFPLGEFHEREKASMSLISEGKGGLQFSLSRAKIQDLSTYEELGTLNFGDENFYKIATICSEKVGDKVKNVLGSVKNMTNNINGYFTEKSRSEAISSGSEAISDAKQLTTSLQADMQDRNTNESKEPAEEQEEAINYNVLMEMMQEESKLAFQQTEGRNEGGLEYERKVLSALVAAQIPGLEFEIDSSAGFSNQGAGDIEAMYNGKKFNIEVKSGGKDQMGGTSIRCNFETDTYEIVNFDAVDPAAIPYYKAAASEKKDAFIAWKQFIQQQEPVELHARMPNAIPPGPVAKDAWTAARQQGLLVPFNKTEQFSGIKNIIAHYNKKGVYYIQIGGAGLFYLGRDDVKLGVPPLEAQMQVEFGFRPSGSKPSAKYGIRVVGAGYRCQGRLKSKVKSPYTLDDPNSIRELFGQLNNK